MQPDRQPLGVPIGMLRPNIVLPSQHFPPHLKQAPEQRLMIAVLQDAIDCVDKYRVATDSDGRRLFAEAAQWVLADENEWPYSFECICDVLGLDASAVRYRLRLTPEQPTILMARRGNVAKQQMRNRC